MANPIFIEPAQVKSALTKTGGFLAGYTHSLQPYVGCAFGRNGCGVYCYLAQSPIHHFRSGGLAWGDYVYPKANIAEVLRTELQRHQQKGRLDTLRIFMSSATDPYQPVEAKAKLSRACLAAFIDFPPQLLVIQTRSPLVKRDFDLIAGLGQRAWLSFSIETDDQTLLRRLTPATPPLAARYRTVEAAHRAGLQVQVTISPFLPLKDPTTFANWLADHTSRIVVDTFLSGDGSQGDRTRRGQLPQQFQAAGLGDWRDEDIARAFYEQLVSRLGPERVGWSEAGFNEMPTNA
jgi:DNA repair photolyase